MSDLGRSPSSVANGEILAGRYRLERLIGRGGMAEVWSALDLELDRRVAVKSLRASLADDEVIAERFRREALAVAKLSHPNIVAIHDVISHEGQQSVVMQLVDGKSLRVHLDKQKRLGPELTIHIGTSMASALDAAHQAKLVHRDVKPGNILLTSDGRVLLTDFGIAKALDGSEEDLTSDNVMMGTAKYLSPEQVRGKPLDGRADLYALGLVLYESLAGRVPFLGETDADTALARLQRDPTDLGHLRPTVPIGLVNLIHKLLARNPAHRPQTGAELRAALLAIDTTPPAIDPTPDEPPDRRARKPRPMSDSRVHADPASDEPPAAQPSDDGDRGSARRSKSAPQSGVDARSNGRDDDAAAAPSTDADRGSVASIDPLHSGSPNNSRNEPDKFVPRRPKRSDDTPTGFQQRLGPTRAAVLTLAGIAVAVMLVLLYRNNRPAPADDLPTGTIAVSVAPADNGPVTIAKPMAYDPEGDNGSENDSEAPLALADDDPATFWSTECYQNEYLGGNKAGVGLVISLTNAGTGTLSFDVLSAPYSVDVFVAPDDGIPDSINGWSPVASTFRSTEPGSIEVTTETPARQLLVWFTQLGPDDLCASTNPYRGKIGELSFSAN